MPRNLLKRQAVKFIVDENGLTMESATATHAVRYRDPSYRGLPQDWETPLEAIQALAKSSATQGEFSLQGEAEIRLHLVEKSIPRDEGFSAPDLVLETPCSPEVGYLLPLNARQALIAAFETTDQRVPGRYALNCIQLQGSKASLAATDGRQLLIQTGLHWPFEEDLLLANYRKLFACGDFPEGPIELCRTERQLVFRVGNWEFFLPIEEAQRYPRVEDVVPAPEEAVANLELSPGDAKYLQEVLPHLPFDVLDHERPVTIELNGKIGVRARSMKTPAGVEVILRNSQRSGVDLLCAMQRRYLQRALDLGLQTFSVLSKGLCARRGSRWRHDLLLGDLSPRWLSSKERRRRSCANLRWKQSPSEVFCSDSVSESCEMEVELLAESPSEQLSGAGVLLQRLAEIVFDACREAVHLELAKYEKSAIDRAKPKTPGARAAVGRSKPHSRSPAPFGHRRARKRIQRCEETAKKGLSGSA